MQTKRLLILGAGQYGMVARETAEAMGCFSKVDFLDDANPAVGKLADFKFCRADYDCAFVAMGNPQLRLGWLQKLEQAGFELPALIHPKAYVSPTAQLMPGTIAEPMAVIQAGAIVEIGGLLCAGCVVNHNAHVMAGCQIDCNAVVAANATVPEGTKLHSGTVFNKQ